MKGAADKPVYISIYNDTVEIKDAAHLTGKDTCQTQDEIRSELGNPEVEVVCIGPAGENMISYASVHTRLGNAAGRTGMAVPNSWEAKTAMEIIEKALEDKRKAGLKSTITQHDSTSRGTVAALANRLSIVVMPWNSASGTSCF